MNSKRQMKFSTAILMAMLPLAGGAAESDVDGKLGGDRLTPVGAERAGNADGTIPEWTGGMTQPPAGYEAGGPRIDPFADEEPVFTITAENYQQYGDKLTAGQKALFEKYPDTFSMPIYPTHRVAAAPEWVYENTKENAAKAELTEDGNGVVKAFGGYPFPKPENGLEAIWNHLLRWQGDGSEKTYYNLTVYDNGSTAIGGGTLWEDYPYYDRQESADSYNGNIVHLMISYNLPVRRKGEVILVRDPVNQNINPRQAWQYIPGQRRVRRAPTIAFDSPSSSASGLTTYDDGYMYNGSPERYNWELIGKEEMYVPYNNNRVFVEAAKGEDKVAEIFPANHMNPDYSRWELHRVWVVEATLKDDERHIYERRRYYLDEDTWTILASDLYDGRDQLWRAGFANVLNAYDVPLTAIRALWYVDFQANAYGVIELDVEPARYYEGEEDSFFTPNGIRRFSRR